MSRQANIPRAVSSANLPSRLGTPEIPISLHERRVANLPISKNIDAFEQKLNNLLWSISRYAPSTEYAQELLSIHRLLGDSLEDLIMHQQSGLQIDSLEEESSKVDNNCKQILLGLSECRKKLRSLPSLDNVMREKKNMQKSQIKADDLLAYATKLAKFTTVPPTFDAGSIGPNNFIWPAEDSLRRGMLAVASLNAAKLVGEEDEGGLAREKKTDGEDDDKEEVEKSMRRGSFGGSYGGANDDNDHNVMDDLDLFDPDEL